MCEREVGRLLRLDAECRQVAVFLNLGLIQGDWKMGHPKRELCSDCQTLVEEMRRWVFENTDVFYALDTEIEKRRPRIFFYELWPTLFNTIVQDEASLNEGRLFALFICLTRAGMIWREKGVGLNEISVIQRELQGWLRRRLPNYDWKIFSCFVRQMRAEKRTTILGYASYLLLSIVLVAWKLLGER